MLAEQMLKRLTSRERQVIELRILEGLEVDEVATELEVTSYRVSHLEDRAKKKLRLQGRELRAMGKLEPK